MGLSVLGRLEEFVGSSALQGTTLGHLTHELHMQHPSTPVQHKCKILQHRFTIHTKSFYTGSSYRHNSSKPVHHTHKILPRRFIIHAKSFYTGSSYIQNSSTPVHHTCKILLHQFITHAKFFHVGSKSKSQITSKQMGRSQFWMQHRQQQMVFN